MNDARETQELVVETARPEHLPGIVGVYEAVCLAHSELSPAHGNKGFLLRGYPLLASEFLEVLSDFVLCARVGGEVLGFLLAYENKVFWRLYNQGLIYPGSALGDFFSELGGDFLFGHRIAVSPSARRRDIASHLVLTMRARMAKSPHRAMHICILHGPVRNTASITFSTRLGFELVTEREQPNGQLWGIYCLRLSQKSAL